MNEAPLVDRVRALVQRAAASCTAVASKDRLDGLAERLDEPLRVAIAGKVKAGKSTLLNAIVGQELAPTDAGECTRIVTWYRDGVTYRVMSFLNDGTSEDAQFAHDSGALRVDLRGRRPDEVKRLVVDWPSASLKSITLIDTPGIASVSIDIAEKARAFLIGREDEPTASDAVLYLMRHLHATDVPSLEAFRDQQQAQSTPINAIAILSRADEIGVGKIESMATAERIAARYRTHPEVRRLCQTVVPVSGLIAQAGVVLREEQFASLLQIARLAVEDEAALLLSTDRFLAGSAAIELDARTRETLLHDLGLFGIKVSVAVIRRGAAATAGKLSALLVQLSGLPRLRALLTSQFAERRDILKSHAALLVLSAILREGHLEDETDIARELERIEASAHEFAEIGLLNSLRSGGIVLSDESRDDAERLLGAFGNDIHSRASIATDVGDAELQACLQGAITRWQARAESPLASKDSVNAARVVVRTAEGLLAAASSSSGVAPGLLNN